MSQSVIDRIVWGGKSLDCSQSDYDRNVELVKLLCLFAKPTKWLVTPDVSHKIPYVYELDDVEIQFLPDWVKIVVGGIHLDPPATIEELRKAVEAVQLLIGLGYKPKPAATMY